MHHFRMAALVLLSIAAACSETSEPSPPTFQVAPMQQWSGGNVTIRSGLFDRSGALPTITAEGVAMILIREDDTTVTATLPALPSMDATIQVSDGGKQYTLGVIHVSGFRTRNFATPGFIWDPLIDTAANGAPVAISSTFNQPAQGSISIVDLRTAQTAVETGVQAPWLDYAHGVGGSYQSGHLILRDSTGELGDWQVRPTLAHSDTVPAVIFSRTAHRLANQVWLFASNHETWVRRSGAPDIMARQEDPWGIALSQAADRAVMNSFFTVLGGSPVFQMSTGDTVYRLPVGPRGAAFTSDGSTLFVVGEALPPGGKILKVNAATGAILASGGPPVAVSMAGLVLSADESRIFVGAMTDSIPEVLVFDASNLNLVGHLAATPGTACSSCGSNLLFQAALAMDEATGTLFVVSQGEPALIWEFDLLPSP